MSSLGEMVKLYKLKVKLQNAWKEGAKLGDKPIIKSKTAWGVFLLFGPPLLHHLAEWITEISLVGFQQAMSKVPPIITDIGAILTGLGIRRAIGKNLGGGQ